MILLRHGQSEFNLHITAIGRDPGIIDPKLTPLGHVQARRAAEALRGHGITRIIASPYTRTLQTAAPIARALGLPVEINPVVRERYALSCDIGSRISQQKPRWPEHDFQRIEEIWWPQTEEPVDHVMLRAGLFRREMQAGANWRTTLVVSHWGFILALTGEKVVNGQLLTCDPFGPEPSAFDWRH